MPYLSALEVLSRRGAIQIHVYLYLYLYLANCRQWNWFMNLCNCIFLTYTCDQVIFDLPPRFIIIRFITIFSSSYCRLFLKREYLNPLLTLQHSYYTYAQWLRCNGTQGNAIPHLQFMSQCSRTSECYSVRKRHTTMQKRPRLEYTL